MHYLLVAERQQPIPYTHGKRGEIQMSKSDEGVPDLQTMSGNRADIAMRGNHQLSMLR